MACLNFEKMVGGQLRLGGRLPREGSCCCSWGTNVCGIILGNPPVFFPSPGGRAGTHPPRVRWRFPKIGIKISKGTGIGTVFFAPRELVYLDTARKEGTATKSVSTERRPTFRASKTTE